MVVTQAIGRGVTTPTSGLVDVTTLVAETSMIIQSIQLSGYVGSSSSIACRVSSSGRKVSTITASSSVRVTSLAGDDGAGVRAVRDAVRVQRERRLLDAAAAAELAADVVEHLVGLHVASGRTAP